MLTKDTLIANEALKGLTDEQITAIETLSRNDEDAVIGARFGEVYRQMDATIEKHLGIKRNGDEKTYNFLERASKEFSGKYADYDTLKTTIEDLKAQVAKGGDEALKTQLTNALKELEVTKTQFADLKTASDAEKANHVKALNDYKIESEIARAKEGIKFKTSFNDAVLATLVANAITKVKGMHPSFEDRNGVETLIFHNEDGTPLNNAENKLNPFTAKELLMKEFESMDILDKKPAKGAGGQPPKVNTTPLGATTKVEAHEAIHKMLSEKGISKTDLTYQSEFDKLCTEYEVDKLPLN